MAIYGQTLINELKKLKLALSELESTSLDPSSTISSIDTQSSLDEKIALFRSLFRGRQDVYPKLWKARKQGV